MGQQPTFNAGSSAGDYGAGKTIDPPASDGMAGQVEEEKKEAGS